MNEKRRLNEAKYPSYEELGDGKRRYWLEVNGKHGWKARYVKVVNASEKTLSFYQEIYDDRGELVEVHEKYPVDRGHRTAK